MPPQASIARSTTVRLDTGGSSATGDTGEDDSQHEDSTASAQHEVFAAVEQQLASGAGAAARRVSATITLGSIRLAFAQATSSAGVLQQQFEKHCSAVAQPQGLSMQGNGRERSFTASRLAAGDSGAVGAEAPIGNGSPEATSV
jgi:hypothetical protein